MPPKPADEIFGQSRNNRVKYFNITNTEGVGKAIGKLCSHDHQAVAITDDLVSNRGPNPLRSGLLSPLEEAPTQPATLYQM